MVPKGGRYATIPSRAILQAALRTVSVLRGPGNDRPPTRRGTWRAGDRTPTFSGSIDDLPRATPQRGHARWRSRVPRHERTVARRSCRPPPEAGEAGGQSRVAALRAGPPRRRDCRPGRGRGGRTGRALEWAPARAPAASALGPGVEPGADCPSPPARLP